MFEPTTQIDRVYFLIHPCCWAMTERPDPDYLATYGVLASEWYAARNHEREVNQKQKALIESLGPNEAMADLVATAQRRLGPRCVVLALSVCEPPSQLTGMAARSGTSSTTRWKGAKPSGT